MSENPRLVLGSPLFMKKNPRSTKKRSPSQSPRGRKKPPARSKKSPSPRSKNKSPRPRLRKVPIPISPGNHPFTLPSFLPPKPTFVPPPFEFLGDLPESYGTRRLFLTARDPHTLFAYWDFSRQQIQEAEKEASDGRVYLRIFVPGQEQVHQIHVTPGSREWFFPTHRPGTHFQAELGYYQTSGSFHPIAATPTILTPPDAPSSNHQIQFVTIPFHYSFRQLWDLIRNHLLPGEALAQALARLQLTGHPFPFSYAIRRWVSSQSTEKIFFYLSGDFLRHRNFGSFAMTELLRRRIETCPKPGSSHLHGTSPGNPPPAS
ncbi:MAG: DUF4912 domain-containing protein [Verrucomicrobia bacterium]|nr:DUF4912 domain-containing protein [Verrucomicrobiota bacterium]